jgi:hypothetical protein
MFDESFLYNKTLLCPKSTTPAVVVVISSVFKII